MLIGLSFFGLDEGAVFKTEIGHGNYHYTEMSDGLIDQVFIDTNTSIDNSTIKFEGFNYTSSLNSKFNNSLEAGSVGNTGNEIESIRFQKRRLDELYWTDVGEVRYEGNEKKMYELFDRNVQNDFDYEYSMLPVTSDILGTRSVSSPITIEFEGYFLSDNNNNYQILYNAELNSIEHVSNSTVTETLNSRFPIVTYGNSDYRQGTISGMIISNASLNGIVDIRLEKQLRQQILAFLKNRKPKILRTMNGELMIVSIIENPSEEPNQVVGISTISFNFVEIAENSSQSLIENGLLFGLSEV